MPARQNAEDGGGKADRAAARRKAFTGTMANPALQMDARKAGLDIDVIGGAELQAKVAELFALPSGVVERAKQSLTYKAASRRDRSTGISCPGRRDWGLLDFIRSPAFADDRLRSAA
jgi:hypothetical protein